MAAIHEAEIFNIARRIETAEARRAYLDQVCGGDAMLRGRVEALLRVQEEDESFLVAPPADVDAGGKLEPVTEQPGEVIGNYRLMEQIGEGGMGVVYVAEQRQPVRRRVALKIIRPGMDTRDVVARFEAERQALALMDHPHIARVFDGGATESGRPYFVMELVRGVPITEYCDQRRLTNRERLVLFSDVCGAIQHAHQKGIIHRDIKPGNVLVTLHDDKAVVKVIDFGVAKATNRELTQQTVYTRFAQMIGTPLYMSPEQAELSGLDVDTRSDIYSLGVLLYELLTGSTPFDRELLHTAGFDEIRRIIREEDPPRPSARISTLRAAEQSTVSQRRRLQPRELSHALRGDLDWIVMRSLEKDRARRYESAGALAADVERYLADEPVEACPPSAGYRLRKFVRRNRGAVVATLVVTAALLVGASLAMWQGMRAARAEAVTARQGVEVDRRLGEALGELQTLIANAKSASPGDTEAWVGAREAAERARTLAEHELADRALVQRVAALAGEIDQGQRDRQLIARLEDIRLLQTATNAEKSRFRRRLALPEYLQVFSDEGMDPRSVTPAEAAARVRGRSPAVAAALLAALNDWLDILTALQEQEPSAESGQLREQVAALVDAVDPDEWRIRMRAAAEAKDYESLLELAGSDEVHEQPPSSLAMLGSALCAEQEHWETGIALLQRAQREDPGNFWINRALGMEFLYAKHAQPHEAVRYYAAAVAIRPDTAGAHLNLANALGEDGKLEQAVAEYERAIALAPNYAAAHNSLGALLCDQLQQYEAAEAAFRRAIELDPQDSTAHSNLGTVLSNQSRLEEAIAMFGKAIALDPDNALAHNNLGVALARQRKPEEALDEYRRAVDLEPDNPLFRDNLCSLLIRQGEVDEAMTRAREGIALDPEDAKSRINLSNVLRLQEKYEQALAEAERAIELEPHSPVGHNTLGFVLRDMNRLDEAVAAHRRAVEVAPDHANSHHSLGRALADQGEFDEAIPAYREAIRLDPHAPGVYDNLGIALEEQGKHEEALAIYREGVARHPDEAAGHHNLGVCLGRLDRPQEAIAALREAVRLDPDFFGPQFSLGILLGAAGDLEGAMDAYREAIRIHPDDPRPHNNLGEVLLRSGQVEAALAELRETLRLDPQDADGHGNLGNALFRLGQFQDAIAAYRKAMELNPDYEANCRVSIGWTLDRLEKWDEAAEEFRQAIRIQPSLADAHAGLGCSLFRQGQAEEAAAACREAIRLDPAAGRPHNILGLGLWEQGQNSEAINAFRRAVKLSPHQADFHFNLGHHLLLADEDLDEAARALKQAIQLKPDVLAYDSLGSVLSRQYKNAEAIAAFEAAIRLQPDYALAHHNLGQTCRRTWDFAKALDAYRNAEKYGAETPEWQYNSAGLVRWVERHLRFEKLAARRPADPTVLRGQLTPGDFAPDQLTSVEHGVGLAAGTAYSVELVTAAFDSVLIVEDAAGKLLARCDDIAHGENHDARLLLTPQQAESVQIVVHGTQPTDAGPYFLRVRPLKKAGKPDVIRRAPKDASADLADRHEVQLDKPGLCVLDVQADFEVDVSVLAADGRTLMTTETSAKRQRLLLEAEAGKYRVAVSPVEPDAEYTLTIQRYQPLPARGGAQRKTKDEEKR